VAQRFLDDLRWAVARVQEEPASSEGLAPVYGMAATVPARAIVSELLERYVDLLYEV